MGKCLSMFLSLYIAPSMGMFITRCCSQWKCRLLIKALFRDCSEYTCNVYRFWRSWCYWCCILNTQVMKATVGLSFSLYLLNFGDFLEAPGLLCCFCRNIQSHHQQNMKKDAPVAQELCAYAHLPTCRHIISSIGCARISWYLKIQKSVRYYSHYFVGIWNLNRLMPVTWFEDASGYCIVLSWVHWLSVESMITTASHVFSNSIRFDCCELLLKLGGINHWIGITYLIDWY